MLVDRNTKIILLLIASGLWANALVSCIGATASWYSLVESAMPGVDDITQSACCHATPQSAGRPAHAGSEKSF